MNRRQFLKASATASGGLLLSAHLPALAGVNAQGDASQINDVIEIASDGNISVYVVKQEMGHGIATGLAMIVAEELDANWSDVQVKFQTFDSNFKDFQDEFGRFDTGGSNSVDTEWNNMRTAGATAKAMLVKAAAKSWGISESDCRAKAGKIVNQNTNEELGYGKLAAIAATLQVPEVTTYKATKDYSIVGEPLPALKNRKVVEGTLEYGIDATVQGMIHAMVVRPPHWGGSIANFDASAARNVKGVIDVITLPEMPRDWVLDRGTRGGIAILGKSTWACMKARKELEVQWQDGPHARANSNELYAEYDKFKGERAWTSFEAGDVEQGYAQADKVIERSYTSPYIAHALMEPLNAIADFVDGKHLHIYAGTQSPGHSAHNLAKALKIEKKDITITPYHMGGGYGRRYFCDFMLEAALISQAAKLPVKLTWTREDEIQVGAYHPMRKDFMKCGVDKEGNIEAFELSAVSAHEWAGGEMSLDYGYKNIKLGSKRFENSPVVCGSWRAVVAHIEIFMREVFIDEVANEVGQDPLAYRLRQLQRPVPDTHTHYHKPELLKELAMRRRIYTKLMKEAAAMAGWTPDGSNKRGKNRGLGVAFTTYHAKSFAAQVADVEVIDGQIKVHNIYCAADCGLVINPNLVEAQIESSILWGLTPVLYGGVDIVNGNIKQSNFHDMPLARMKDCPNMQIKLFNEEDRMPCGVGEFAVVPVAPAISNAIYAGTGVRHRHLHMA